MVHIVHVPCNSLHLRTEVHECAANSSQRLLRFLALVLCLIFCDLTSFGTIKSPQFHLHVILRLFLFFFLLAFFLIYARSKRYSKNSVPLFSHDIKFSITHSMFEIRWIVRLLLITDLFSQSKITNFKNSSLWINKDILWLDISMNQSLSMNVRQSTHKLNEVEINSPSIQAVLFGIHNLS